MWKLGIDCFWFLFISFDNILTKKECQQIINTALNDWDERESMIQRDESGEIKQNFKEDFDYRNTTLFIPKQTDEWLFNKILSAIMSFNNADTGYKFDIRGMAEPPNVMRYRAPDLDPNNKPGKYDWHMDIGPGPVPSMRKISFIELCRDIGLNVPDTYTIKNKDHDIVKI